MNKPTRTAEDADVLAATLKEGDLTLAALREKTGLDETRVIRATNLLKAQRRLENAANGLLHLVEPVAPGAEQPQADSEAKSDQPSIEIPAPVVARAVAAVQTGEESTADKADQAAQATPTPEPAPASAETLASAAAAMAAPAPAPAEPSPNGDALKAENVLLKAELEMLKAEMADTLRQINQNLAAALEGQRRERTKRQRALLALKALKHTPQGEALGASILRQQIRSARQAFDRTGNPILKVYLPIDQLANRAVDMLLELERKHQTALETIDRLRVEVRKAAAQPTEQPGAHG
jgi:hypothetical protein